MSAACETVQHYLTNTIFREDKIMLELYITKTVTGLILQWSMLYFTIGTMIDAWHDCHNRDI